VAQVKLRVSRLLGRSIPNSTLLAEVKSPKPTPETFSPYLFDAYLSVQEVKKT
jgi:hypothetical protein